MSSLIDSNALSNTLKRPFEPSQGQSRGFPLNFKRRKVDAVREFPVRCSGLGPGIKERQAEGVTGVAITPKFEKEWHRVDVTVKSSGISVAGALRSKGRKVLVLCDTVEAKEKMMLANVDKDELVNVLENVSQPNADMLCRMKSLPLPQSLACVKVEAGNMMTPCDVEMKLPKALKKDGLENVLENASPPKTDTLDGFKMLSPPWFLAKKYPPPKIRKGVNVVRQFPLECERINKCSSSNSWDLAPKFDAEHQSVVVESIKTGAIHTGEEFYDADTRGNATKLVNKVHAGPISLGEQMHKQVQGGKSSEYDGAQKEDRVEITAISKTEGDLLRPDFKCHFVSGKINRSKSLIQRLGSDSVKCVKIWGAEDESGAMIQSHEVESLNLVPSLGSGVITEQQQGKMVSTFKLNGAYRGCKIQNLVDVDGKSEDLLWKMQAEMKNVARNCARMESLVCGMNTADQCLDTKEHKYIFAASNDLDIVPFDNFQVVVSRNNVREVLNLFRETLRSLSQEPQSISMGKAKAVRQIHMEAAMVLKNQGKWNNTDDKLVGPISGVEVGDRFHFRVELVIIGLHRQFIAGIDYMKKDGKMLATSIVASGRYANRAEFSNVLIYSGQGGNQLRTHMQPEDQKLERGNLALKNSMEAKTPVRVIIGQQQVSKESRIKGTRNKSIEKIYTYDGLYLVTRYWQERKQHGKLVFMFQLDRVPGQPKLTWNVVNKSKSKRSRLHKDLLVVDDISHGKEKMPIRAMNEIDDEKPPLFNYITNMIYQEAYVLSIPSGCGCIDGCSDSKKCSCALKNGGEIPFNNNGYIIKAKSIVYECGPFCSCLPSCKNRVSQNGIKYQLEVFRTDSKGWGVRSRNYISSGSFICEYVGELLKDSEAEERTSNDEYLFDIGNGFSNGDGYTIDAAQHGNVGRFINHSCSPNLYAQDIIYDHDDKRMPHIMLFATRNIPPLRELTYDYNYKVDQVHDLNGNIKTKNCYCGSRECTGRMY